MKKMISFCILLAGTATAAFAQESRQDISLSGTFLFAPQVNGAAVQVNTNSTVGALASYRYMLTPRSALEANYGFAQYTDYLRSSSFAAYKVHARQQEVSLGYVYSRNYHNFNPYVEGGVAAVFFAPLRDAGTTTLDAKSQTQLGGMFGGGVAYEISPSFDVRLGYHGVFVKTPSFKIQGGDNYDAKRYEVISTPALGIAYHF